VRILILTLLLAGLALLMLVKVSCPFGKDPAMSPWSVKSSFGTGFMKRIPQSFWRNSFKTSIREFFGSWFEFQGKRQIGYFLGHEFIRWLQRERGLGLQEIARLPLEEIRSQMESHRKAVLEGALER
jgi:hypothetical protein